MHGPIHCVAHPRDESLSQVRDVRAWREFDRLKRKRCCEGIVRHAVCIKARRVDFRRKHTCDNISVRRAQRVTQTRTNFRESHEDDTIEHPTRRTPRTCARRACCVKSTLLQPRANINRKLIDRTPTRRKLVFTKFCRNFRDTLRSEQRLVEFTDRTQDDTRSVKALREIERCSAFHLMQQNRSARIAQYMRPCKSFDARRSNASRGRNRDRCIEEQCLGAAHRCRFRRNERMISHSLRKCAKKEPSRARAWQYHKRSREIDRARGIQCRRILTNARDAKLRCAICRRVR